jgi:heme/copper-type cytochrome/quinol oxidase subunit 3
MSCFLLSGLLFWLGSRRPADQISTGVVAILLALCGVIFQFIEYATLGFGPTSGGYASVFFGWTATYALGALWGIYWMEISVASIWRQKREGSSDVREDLLQAGYSACTICWTFFVAIGVIMFIVLYLV